jgi:hypothetical protein
MRNPLPPSVGQPFLLPSTVLSSCAVLGACCQSFLLLVAGETSLILESQRPAVADLHLSCAFVGGSPRGDATLHGVPACLALLPPQFLEIRIYAQSLPGNGELPGLELRSNGSSARRAAVEREEIVWLGKGIATLGAPTVVVAYRYGRSLRASFAALHPPSEGRRSTSRTTRIHVLRRSLWAPFVFGYDDRHVQHEAGADASPSEFEFDASGYAH